MTPVNCRVKHAPEDGKFGDCLRACIASLLNLQAEDVPHFYEDNCDGATGQKRVNDFLASRNLAAFCSGYGGELSREEILFAMRELNPNTHYLLFGSLPNGSDHVVVCKGGEVVHNPSWFPEPLVGPNSNGFWVVMVLAVK